MNYSILKELNLQNQSIEFKCNFKYNYYDKNENETSDTYIDDKNINYKFINIDLDINTINESDNINDNIEVFNNIKREIVDLQKTSKINRINDKNRNLINFNINYKDELIDKLNKDLDINETRYSQAIKFFKKNKSINLEKNKDSVNTFKFLSKNINNNNIILNHNIINNNSIINNEMLENYKPFYTKVFKELKQKINSILVGVLITKFEVLEENYIKKSEKFYLNENLNRNIKINKMKQTIKDSCVCYGKQYVYLIEPVILFSKPKLGNYQLIDYHLISSNQVLTNKINCIENIKPDIATGLDVRKNKNNIEIFWNKVHSEKNDIKGYIVFKRKNINESFMIHKIIDFTDFGLKSIKMFENIDDNLIIRKQNNYNNVIIKNNFIDEIFSIVTFDAHGNISNYSSQLQITKNMENINKHKISVGNAPIDMPNLFISKDIIKENIKFETIIPHVINKKIFKLFCTPDYYRIKINNEYRNIIKEKYKFSIFKLENNDFYIDDINIKVEK